MIGSAEIRAILEFMEEEGRSDIHLIVCGRRFVEKFVEFARKVDRNLLESLSGSRIHIEDFECANQDCGGH